METAAVVVRGMNNFTVCVKSKANCVCVWCVCAVVPQLNKKVRATSWKAIR